jgi:dihydroxyacetone kinase phosphotransfer subunit
MVNILLVSHSHQLAEGTAALARQMASSGALEIRVAAGIGDDHSEIGTDAVEILEALNDLTENAEVLVLMDLGSALLSTDMALEMMDEEMRKRVHLSPAPFVEGAIAAAVQANMGASVRDVANEALQSLAAKQQQLSTSVTPEPAPEAEKELEPEAIQATGQTLILRVPNPTGLHARPAALFAKTIRAHDAKVTVTNLDGENTPHKITGLISVMLLSAKQGDSLKIEAEGPQATEVLAAIQALADENFGD